MILLILFEQQPPAGIEKITELPPLTYRKGINLSAVKMDQPKPNLDEILIAKIDT